jgi:hypothetical protein
MIILCEDMLETQDILGGLSGLEPWKPLVEQLEGCICSASEALAWNAPKSIEGGLATVQSRLLADIHVVISKNGSSAIGNANQGDNGAYGGSLESPIGPAVC